MADCWPQASATDNPLTTMGVHVLKGGVCVHTHTHTHTFKYIWDLTYEAKHTFKPVHVFNDETRAVSSY